MTRTSVLALLLALVGVTVAGCSDDDGGNAAPYVEALSESMQESDDENDFPLEADDADCVAERTIDAFGADFLEENDITPEDVAESDGPQDFDVEVSEEQARNAAEAFEGCDLPLAEIFAEIFAGEAPSDEAVACVDENLDTDAFVEALTQEYLGNADESEEISEEAFTPIQEECGELLGG